MDSPHCAAVNAEAFDERPTLLQPQADAACADADDVEAWVENDPLLVHTGPSRLLVRATVLEPQEVAALLDGLSPLLERDGNQGGDDANADDAEAADDRDCDPEDADRRDGDRQDLDRQRADRQLDVRTHTFSEGPTHEPHPAADRRDRRDSKLPALAWLFPDHAGAGRPARHEQGDDLRARRRPGKKARPAPRQAQGSLFGNHLRG